MNGSLLTSEDKAWLAENAEITVKRFSFLLNNLRKYESTFDGRLARSVPIWVENRYVEAGNVYKLIESLVPFSQIYEQWSYRVYQDLIKKCAMLSSFDSEVLLVVSGYSECLESELADACAEAVTQAYYDLYGDPEDHI